MTAIPEPFIVNHILSPKIITLVFCHWCGIHQSPTATSRFLSTSTHYPGIWLRNTLPVPWGLHTSMTSFSLPVKDWHHWPSTERLCMVFDNKKSIHTMQNVLQYLDNHYHYRWSLSCLLMTYIIGWFSDIIFPCSTSDHIFTWLESYLSERLNEIEDPISSFIHAGYGFRSTKSYVQWHYTDGHPFMIYIYRWLSLYM